MYQGKTWGFLGLLVCCAALLAPNTSALNTQLLRFNPDGTGTLRHQSTRPLTAKSLRAGALLDFANNQLVIRRSTGPAILSIIDHSINLGISGMYGLHPRVSVGAHLPLNLIRHLKNDGSTNNGTHFRLGDVRTFAKWNLLDDRRAPVGVALLPYINIPTGQATHYLSDGGFTYGATVNVDRHQDRFYVVGSLGFHGRARSQVVNLSTGITPFSIKDEFVYGLGMAFELVPDTIRMIVDLAGSTPITAFAERENTSPLEATGTFEYRFEHFALKLGGGGGLIKGYGSPDYRVFSGLSYVGKAAPRKVRTPQVHTIVLQGTTFGSGRADLSTDAERTLAHNVSQLAQYAEYNIRIAGHTDDLGDNEVNLELSQRRADAVRDFFIAHGIAAERIVSLGYGEARPLVPNTTAEHRARNRRVVIDLIAKDSIL